MPTEQGEMAIIMIFADRPEAERAARDLQAAGFGGHQIATMIRGADATLGGMIPDASGTKDTPGTVTGMTVGRILGAMAGLRISTEEAEYFQQHFDAGKATAAVKPGSRFAEAEQILSRHGGYNRQFHHDGPVPTEGFFSKP